MNRKLFIKTLAGLVAIPALAIKSISSEPIIDIDIGEIPSYLTPQFLMAHPDTLKRLRHPTLKIYPNIHSPRGEILISLKDNRHYDEGIVFVPWN